MNRNKIVIIIIAVILYLVSTGASYLFFAKVVPRKYLNLLCLLPTAGTNGQLIFDKTLPKTEACPINGVLYSKQQEQWWQKHRPLGVMIENHVDARPQSGLIRCRRNL